MSLRFKRHYTREEARDLLPQVRQWLERLQQLRDQIELYDKQSEPMIQAGDDIGGQRVNKWIANTTEFKRLMHEFESREIQVKDLQRGQIDFPTLIGDKEACLCWEQGEEDIRNWHELDSGNAGEQRAS